jgi:hypothetical protein
MPVITTPGKGLRVDVRLVSLIQRAPPPHGCSASAKRQYPYSSDGRCNKEVPRDFILVTERYGTTVAKCK